MDKEFHKTLSQVPMFSKMGKYISNKILKYNRSESRKARRPPTPPYDYLSKTKKEAASLSKNDPSPKNSTHLPKAPNAGGQSPNAHSSQPGNVENNHSRHHSQTPAQTQIQDAHATMSSSSV